MLPPLMMPATEPPTTPQPAENRRKGSDHVNRKSSWGTDIPAPRRSGEMDVIASSISLVEIDLNSPKKSTLRDGASVRASTSASTGLIALPQHQFFGIWINSMRRRSVKRRKTVPAGQTPPLAIEECKGHKKSDSATSSAFVAQVRTASISQGSFSVLSTDRRKHWLRSGTRSTRTSEEQTDRNIAPIDEGILQRGIKRQSLLTELVKTEEGYVEDLKVLTNIYFDLLSSLSGLSDATQESVKRNLNDLLTLHETLLSELYKTIPGLSSTSTLRDRIRDNRRRSLELISAATVTVKPQRNSIDVPLKSVEWQPLLVTDPVVAANVAIVFHSMMKRFFAYEEYGAKYEKIVEEVASSKRLPFWAAVERGVESLALTVASQEQKKENAKKGLTLGDLLIKPIQRICRYPLLFDQLYDATPVCDSPDSHAVLEKVRYRLRETAREINRATNDPKVRERIEKTWLLQDRLVVKSLSTVQIDLRLLGHTLLCGVLHVAWQTNEGEIHGEYMASILYRSYLVLARFDKDEGKLNIAATMNLAELHIESANSAKGLTCYSAPFSWKTTFESSHRLFELILSACSPVEEEIWRSHITERANAESNDSLDGHMLSPDLLARVDMNIMCIGDVFGRPGTLARRISLHKSGTTGKQGMCQVIINNTFSLSERQSSVTSPRTPPPSIVRSQSLIHVSRVPMLSPRRSERMKLEDQLADVWTRDVLPYPRMIRSSHARRGEGLVRDVAVNVMRKISIASITSSFTRCSSSQHSLRSPDKTVLRITNENEENKTPSPQINFESMSSPKGRSDLLSETLIRRTKAAAKKMPLEFTDPIMDRAEPVRTVSTPNLQRSGTPCLLLETNFQNDLEDKNGIRKSLVRSGSNSLRFVRKGMKQLFA